MKLKISTHVRFVSEQSFQSNILIEVRIRSGSGSGEAQSLGVKD